MKAIGKVLKVEENEWVSAQRGPQTDLVLTLAAEGDSTYEESFVVSYKCQDKFRALKPGQTIIFPVFLEVVPAGKKGPWVKKIAMDVEVVGDVKTAAVPA